MKQKQHAPKQSTADQIPSEPLSRIEEVQHTDTNEPTNIPYSDPKCILIEFPDVTEKLLYDNYNPTTKESRRISLNTSVINGKITLTLNHTDIHGEFHSNTILTHNIDLNELQF